MCSSDLGTTVVRTDDSRVLLELAPGTDDQAVLKAGLATGPVREFRPAEPSLVELFRDVVGEAQADAAEAAQPDTAEESQA